MMNLRSPIVCILAHVDHGKTSLLDHIRGSAIAKKEPGAITQMIGAYYLPKKTIIELAEDFGKKIEATLQVPGILFIDTPGHEAFTSMRQRGGSISDMAILLIDITQGVQQQTIESLDILISNKTPFIVALNKVDLIDGWIPQQTASIQKSLSLQPQFVSQRLEEKLYSIIGQLSQKGLNAERFDRVTDFTKELVVIPCSAKTGEGTAEILLYLSGLAQKYLSKNLYLNLDSPAKGSILEIKEEKGLGITLDAIIYDGVLEKNDWIVFAKTTQVAKTKIRALLRPFYPDEKPQAGQKYKYVDSVSASAGIKIYAKDLEGAISGSPLYSLKNEADFQKVAEEINQTIKNILLDNAQSNIGVIVKTDSLGSAEAFLNLLKSKSIPIKRIGIGPITKKDVIDAYNVRLQDKFSAVILGFNVDILPEAQKEIAKNSIKVFNSNIIFRAFEEYLAWIEEEKKKEQELLLCSVSYPVKLRVLPNCFFRLCKPAIFGVEVLVGKLKPKSVIQKEDGTILGEVRSIQHEKQPVDQALAKWQVAISIDECYCGKTIKEGDILYSYLTKAQISLLKKNCENIFSKEELELLDEISKITKS